MKILKLKNFNRKCTLRYDEQEEGAISFDGGIFKLNETSYNIIMLLEERKSNEEIITILSKKYNVSKEIIKEDFIEFLNEIKMLGLIE